jgi:lipoate-protein ligase A
MASQHDLRDHRVLDLSLRRGTLTRARACLPRAAAREYDLRVAALDAVFLPALEPALLLGLELHLMDSAAAGRVAPVLLVHSAPHSTIALGRYHLYAGATESGGLRAYRRLTGGRAAGAGPGWIWIALIAPDRTALLPERDRAIAPEQLMNRYARGVLAALRTLGIDCFYPGRDAITSNRREIAMCSYECARSGAMLFEAALAVGRGMVEFVRELDSLDAAADITCPMYNPESATTMARELGRVPAFREIASALAAGFASLAGDVRVRELTVDERAQAARRGAELAASGWLRRDGGGASFNRTSRAAAQLGAMQARLMVLDDATIGRAMLSGEFIANSAGVAEFECALAGRRFAPDAIAAAVSETFADGRNFILGLGAPGNLARMVAQAQ